MPAYMTQPASFQNRPLMVPGKKFYLFGSYNSDISPTLAFVTNVALSGNVATVTLKLTAGNIPTTSQTITIAQCSNTVFNVTGSQITGVSGFNSGDNSAGTVTFALTHADVVSAAATGNVILPTPVGTDACATSSSQQVTLPFNDPRIDQSRTIVFQAGFPSIPTSCTLVAQESDDDVTYYDIGTIASVSGATVTGGLLSVSAQSAKWYRADLRSVIGGTSPTVWCTISA